MSLIPMGPGSGGRQLGLQIPEGQQIELSYSHKVRGLRLKSGKIVELKTGMEKIGKILEAGEKYLIHLPAPATPLKTHFATSFNPDLLKFGEVFAAPLMDAQSVQDGKMFIRFQPDQFMNLADLPFIFEIYNLE